MMPGMPEKRIDGYVRYGTTPLFAAGAGLPRLGLGLLDLRPGMSVLDLACGRGDLACRLAAHLRPGP